MLEFLIIFERRGFEVPIRLDKNQAAQPNEMARGFKFQKKRH